MADFRKLFYALAVVVLLLSTVTTASAQLSCTATATPLAARNSGIAEVMGDILLDCTGGTPTAAGVVPTYNIQLTMNTNITSPLIADPLALSTLMDAALLIDNPTAASLNSGVGGAHLITPGAIAAPIPVGPPPVTAYSVGVIQNIYLARTAGARTIQFTNVPIDPPPATLHRYIRITNVRADVSAVQPAFLQGTITISNGTVLGTPLSLTSNAPIVGIPQGDIAFTTRNVAAPSAALTAAVNIAQCNSINSPLVSSTTNTPTSIQMSLRFAETSTTAFKTVAREAGTLLGLPTATVGGSLPLPTIGAPSSGTRVIAFFTGVPAGSRLFVGDRNSYNAPAPVVGGAAGALAKLITAADGNGSGGALPALTSGTTGVFGAGAGNAAAVATSFNLLTVTGGAATATWEVVVDDPAQLETLDFLVVVSAAAAAVPVGTAATGITGSLAPVSTTITPVLLATAAAPRFKNSAIAGLGYVFATCVSNLLFPFVTNSGVLNTGIAVSNTSQDIFATATQAGTCTINYFGETAGGGSVPTPQTSASIAAGKTLLFDLKSGGNGVGATPGFSGYLIASCNFKFAHGIAFITDPAVSNLAFGYTALQMDASALRATGAGLSDALAQ